MTNIANGLSICDLIEAHNLIVLEFLLYRADYQNIFGDCIACIFTRFVFLAYMKYKNIVEIK